MRVIRYVDSDGDILTIRDDPLDGDHEDLWVCAQSHYDSESVVVRIPLTVLRSALERINR